MFSVIIQEVKTSKFERLRQIKTSILIGILAILLIITIGLATFYLTKTHYNSMIICLFLKIFFLAFEHLSYLTPRILDQEAIVQVICMLYL